MFTGRDWMKGKSASCLDKPHSPIPPATESYNIDFYLPILLSFSFAKEGAAVADGMG